MNITRLIIMAPIFLLSLAVHEAAHGKVADMLGDPTPRMNGRLTLNPIPHIDPFGLLALFVTQRIGWAKPVPINPSYFKDYRKGMMLVGLAGPLSNFVLAGFGTVLYHGLDKWYFNTGGKLANYFPGETLGIIVSMILGLVMVNIGLGIFNLIPFPPLDGSKILGGILPAKYHNLIAELEGGVGMVILIFLAVTGILGNLISPIIMFILKLLGLPF